MYILKNEFEVANSELSSFYRLGQLKNFTMHYQYVAVGQFVHGDIEYLESISSFIFTCKSRHFQEMDVLGSCHVMKLLIDNESE